MLKNKWIKWKRKVFSHILAYTGKYLMRLILFTCRVSVEGLEGFIACARKEKCILILWHNRLAIVAEILNRYAPQFVYTALISQSRDGEALAILVNSYSIGRTIRVPHNARHMALKKLTTRLKTKEEIIIITPDGPRGPCYEIKPGITWAAQVAEAVVIPFSWRADSYWELNTWDRFRLPKPFSKIGITLGEPIKPENIQYEDSMKIGDLLKQALNDVE